MKLKQRLELEHQIEKRGWNDPVTGCTLEVGMITLLLGKDDPSQLTVEELRSSLPLIKTEWTTLPEGWEWSLDPNKWTVNQYISWEQAGTIEDIRKSIPSLIVCFTKLRGETWNLNAEEFEGRFSEVEEWDAGVLEQIIPF